MRIIILISLLLFSCGSESEEAGGGVGVETLRVGGGGGLLPFSPSLFLGSFLLLRPSSSSSSTILRPTAAATGAIYGYAKAWPRRLMGTPKRDDALAMRISQQHAISSPPPVHAPWMTATVGCRHPTSAFRVSATTAP